MRAIEVGIYKKTTVLPQPSEFFNFNAHIIGLHAPKEVLQSRITSRVEEMFKQGYADEVKILIQKYGWDTPALQAIGYKEWQPFLANSITFEQLKISIIQAHLQYARKQMIYLKRIPEVIWIDVSNSDWKQKVIEYCLNRQ